MSIIQLDRVFKCFTLEPERPRSFQELVLGAFRRQPRRPREVLWAVDGVSFGIEPGEMVGLVGSNGSGKSTCLKLLARIFEPTSGTVRVEGRVAALLELGAGFHPELTGRENVYLHGSVLGMPRRDIQRQMGEIVAFAELERFIDVPVKFYSSGMYVRLAFAAAIHVRPDILLIDEVLAVGDQHFQHKCIDHIRKMRAQGVTIVFVSHDLATVGELCDRVLWLHEGRLREQGRPDVILPHYVEAIDPEAQADQVAAVDDAAVANGIEGLSAPIAAFEPPPVVADAETTCPDAAREAEEEPHPSPSVCAPRRWGSGRVEILDVYWLNGHDAPVSRLATDQPATAVIRYRAHQAIDDVVFGVAIHRTDGLHISGCNTRLCGVDLPPIEGTGEMRYHLERLPLLPGEYRLSVAIHKADNSEDYDYRSHWYSLEVGDADYNGHRAARQEGIVYMAADWLHTPGNSAEYKALGTASMPQNEDQP
jgi:lipopolysaccharide transport system ATP-binding protein